MKLVFLKRSTVGEKYAGPVDIFDAFMRIYFTEWFRNSSTRRRTVIAAAEDGLEFAVNQQ